MTQFTTPLSAAFEFQRTAIKQSQQALEQGVEFQKRFNSVLVDSLESQESLQRKGVELNRNAVHTYLDAVEAAVPGTTGNVEEVRETVDEQYDALLDNHAEVFDSVEAEFAEGIETYDEATAEYIEAVDEQIETLIEAHEETEDRTLDAFDQLQTQVEEFQGQVETQVEDMQEQFVQEQAEA